MPETTASTTATGETIGAESRERFTHCSGVFVVNTNGKGGHTAATAPRSRASVNISSSMDASEELKSHETRAIQGVVADKEIV